MQTSKLNASLRELGDELARTQAEANEARDDVARAHENLQAMESENAATKSALESSALSLETATTERQQLEQELQDKSAELQRVRVGIKFKH
jgi:chromosome segregation ATPase